ncbi:hypothetical protein [Candidatus Chloroploca asiatica]|uniref:Uncharacterized protein n=1 Tax=Candidatus Chloroploca asiatica TaxID=1506545 RepID=A0A2H3KRW8_9CHLR|nr:hypothetical protein [Candidatus Chloroploca asiatica]PDW01412.1 hypothetical protein A9Q02_20940 [Candidatus Chloroploca asiatica]
MTSNEYANKAADLLRLYLDVLRKEQPITSLSDDEILMLHLVGVRLVVKTRSEIQARGLMGKAENSD